VPKGIFKVNEKWRKLHNKNICQCGVHYSGIKIFNILPLEIKNIAGNPRKFKHALKKYLNKNYFYTLEKYYKM
jgi:hypothetical protein